MAASGRFLGPDLDLHSRRVVQRLPRSLEGSRPDQRTRWGLALASQPSRTGRRGSTDGRSREPTLRSQQAMPKGLGFLMDAYIGRGGT